MYYGLEPPYRRAYKVSYNRPFQTRATRAVNILFGAEYPLIRSFKPLESIENSHFLFFVLRWLESQGYDVTYQAGIDTDRSVSSPLIFLCLVINGQAYVCIYRQDTLNLLQHKLFLSVGHDEYWSGSQRTKVTVHKILE